VFPDNLVYLLLKFHDNFPFWDGKCSSLPHKQMCSVWTSKVDEVEEVEKQVRRER
jgi:alpha-L-fucosidase